MSRLFRALRPFIDCVVHYAGWVVAGAVLLSAMGAFYAQHLRIDTDFAKLIPSDYDSVQALERLRETVGGESDVAVGIQSPSFEANKTFAEALIPQALDLTNDNGEPYLSRVEFQRDTEFLEDNALYFASTEELDRVESFLDETIEQAKLEANPFYFDVEDDDDTASDDDGAELEAMYNRLIGTEYPISDDSTTMVVRFYPTSTNTDIGSTRALYDTLDSLVAEMEPATYQADMEVTLAGRVYRQFTEIQTIQNDVASSFGVGVGVLLLFVMLYFMYKSYSARVGRTLNGRVLASEMMRAPIMALIIALPLLMSLLWTGGVAYLTFGTLNLMTSTLGLVLFGLGIDFGIHFYGRYAEERGGGARITEAIETTFESTGQAITIGALTTAGALFVLGVADFKGFSEFGVIAGTGVLFALLAMTVVMPAMLTVLERLSLIDLRGQNAAAQAAVDIDTRRYPAARPIVAASALAVVAALALLPQAEFEYDFGTLEPEYEAYEERADVIDEVNTGDGDRRNPAYIVADTQADVPRIVNALREKAQDSTSTILAVESLQERFPITDTTQQAKLDRIASIRETVNENRYLRDDTSDDMQKLRRAAQTRAPIPLDSVPDFLREQFTTRDGELGRFVMVYPSVGLSDGRNSMAFAEEVGTVVLDDGTTYHAGSTSIVAADMLRLMQAEAPYMIGATFLIVMVLMYVNFGRVRWAALALIPLIVGVLWMLLIMQIFDLRLNFYNMVVLPAVLGIGNDAGVHLVHRYREEGFGRIWPVLRSTGEHVTIGSLTTIIGFGGLLLSFHPGLRSIGLLAVVGIGATLLAALTFLPALWQWFEDRGGLWTDRERSNAKNGQTDTVHETPAPASAPEAASSNAG
ncbi:transporter [Longimonas halophila]|uniref:Transporter n=1 Tax=Longimonas halophila TaxID=1469170 RepID=A0A2H3NP28_9BACT|nr:MMPL family transporter [Longimonas halophila]PEN08776.1 transporter [Longimonas halophila]